MNIPAKEKFSSRNDLNKVKWSISVLAHHKRGISAQFARFRTAGLGAFAAFIAVLGPGLLAGLSYDDPAGITTYSVLGTDYGYQLLWIIPASTILLIQFHLMAVRIGAASGKGFVGVIRERWGHGWGYFAVIGLLLQISELFALNMQVYLRQVHL